MAVWVNENTGVGKHFSDLADGATRGPANGGWGHPVAYYRKRKDNRTAEVFANVISVGGASEFSTKLLKRFFPRIYDQAMLILREQK